jgi:type II secretory pathway component HofQ
MLSVSGNKKESPTPIPNTNANDVLEIPEDQLFDREKVVLKFSPEEIADLQRGVALRDIFAARKAEKEADEVVTDQRTEVAADIQQQINNIFPS